MFALVLAISFVFAQTTSDVLLPGLEAYAREDWETSVMYFRKVLSDKSQPQSTISEALYWLILSEISLNDYQSAKNDCVVFLSNYKNSSRVADVEYQYGRVLYLLNDNTESVKQLYDFVKKYPENEKVSSALFWIAESLYDLKNYERASLFYNIIIEDYPSSPKREACFYRIKLIEQTAREEELLQLLKVTHEESLRAAEEYEKKIRSYEQAIQLYQKRIAELEAQVAK